LVKHERSHVTTVLDLQQLISSYQNANKRLFLFDYDGTLTPIVKEPSAAIPSTRLYETLQRLSDDPRNVMWIISGRDTQFLDKWFGNGEIKRLGFSAEHGCFLKEAGKSEWTNLANDFDMSWQDVVYEVMNSYTERTQGSNIEQKRAALTWHYRRSDPDFGSFQAKNLRQHLEETVVPQFDVEVMAGKANVEVRPRQVNKGEIVKRILSESETRPEFIICLGDDQTDEDMFRALQELNDDPSKATIDAKPERRQAKKGIYPVTVGPPSKMTVASWHLLNPTAVLDTLCALADS
jgi:trehalose 6-phosphate synthase/phosphatase